MFGAQFGGSITLLRFRYRVDAPRRMTLHLDWHATAIRAGWSVFLHFVDNSGELRFQADYSLEGEIPDALNFIYSRRPVNLPKALPLGIYRVRLGVWSPDNGTMLPLNRFRGCDREQRGVFHNAIVLTSFEIGEHGIL